MQVLFIKDVPGVAQAGQTKKVADGYARNYLLPKNLAIVATTGALKQVEALQLAVARREAQTLEQAQSLANLLNSTQLTFKMKAGANDRLFGALTAGDIARELERANKISIDKRKIELEHPIKDLGERTVPIKLHPEVTAQIKVVVEQESHP